MENSTNFDDYVFKTKPFAHQLECLQKFAGRKFFALNAEMGTGKTWIIINDLCMLAKRKEIKRVLVLAPNGVHQNWTLREFPTHANESIEYSAFAYRSLHTKAEVAARQKFIDKKDVDLRVLTAHWDCLASPKALLFLEQFCEQEDGELAIVCDESDSIKNPSSQRYKNLMSRLRPHSTYRRTMTGTPVNNSPFDVWAQYRFLHNSIFNPNFYTFKARYAEMLPANNPLVEAIMRGGNRVPQIVAKGIGGHPKYRNLEELNKIIEEHSFRILKTDCLDLPEKIYKTITFELTKEQRMVYDHLVESSRIKNVAPEEDTPVHQLARLSKLCQVSSSYYIHPDLEKEIEIFGHKPKLEILEGLLEAACLSQDKQVIIWARFKREIRDIKELLVKMKLSHVEYHGDITNEDRSQGIDAFQSGKAKVFLGNQQAGATGITLTAADTMIYYSNNFSLRDRLQSEDRAHRIGQKNNVTYIDICASGTVDEKIVGVLRSKKDILQAVADGVFK